jgi:hypothetical protein
VTTEKETSCKFTNNSKNPGNGFLSGLGGLSEQSERARKN